MHDRAITHLRLHAFDDFDHAFQRIDGQAGKVAGLAEDRLLHERIARADGDAVATGDATRLADRRTSIPQNARMFILPADAERLVYLQVLAGFHATPAENALL